jgi:hypothetical protein
MSQNPRQSGLAGRGFRDNPSDGVADSATFAGSVGSFAGPAALAGDPGGAGHNDS